MFTAALLAQRAGLAAVVRWSLWAFLACPVVATAYFGWHYLVDDVAGLAMGATAVAVAEVATRRGGPPDEAVVGRSPVLEPAWPAPF